GTRVFVHGHVAVGAPVAHDLARVHVEHGHAPVAVAVRDVDLAGLRVEGDLGRPPEVLGAVRAELPAGDAVLGEEGPIARELEHVPVSLPVPADPDVVHRVDGDAVVRGRPGVALPGTAPRVHQVALGSNS